MIFIFGEGLAVHVVVLRTAEVIEVYFPRTYIEIRHAILFIGWAV